MKSLVSIIILVLAVTLSSQNIIELGNPSFEGIPGCCVPPDQWETCEKKEFSTPDVQPGEYEVEIEAIDGETYLGLVTCDNNTWEFVSQQLSSPIKEDHKCSFSIYLAQSSELIDFSNETGELENYDVPIKLRIWGCRNNCTKSELLAESPLIDHEEWLEYEFVFNPRETYDFITFEAFYKTPTLNSYNGNILLDNCSEIENITLD
jgi:hypothetical protein